VHAGFFLTSLASLQHMWSFSLVPDAAYFHNALRAVGSTSDVSVVLEIMAGFGVSPTVPVIVTVVHKLASNGDFESGPSADR
jgi:hypothetical protein